MDGVRASPVGSAVLVGTAGRGVAVPTEPVEGTRQVCWPGRELGTVLGRGWGPLGSPRRRESLPGGEGPCPRAPGPPMCHRALSSQGLSKRSAAPTPTFRV